MRRSISVILVVASAAALNVACIGRPDLDATGEEVYLQVCANCHGADLSGGLGPAIGPGTNSAVRDDEYLELTITRGLGRMPSFGGTLTDEQVERLIRYLREVQG
ncbi:MAG TPA: cytochrome c [Acidimicrobiia bacterium]|jgi:mono/diheme cytochrome c family protein